MTTPDAGAAARPRVAFVLEPILGHATHARNLQHHVPAVGRIDPVFRPIPFGVEGYARHIPGFRSNWTVRSGLRARRAIRGLYRNGGLEGLFVHTQVPAVLAPDWVRKLPTVVSIDATPKQIDALGIQYEHLVGSTRVESVKQRLNQLCFDRARHIVTWSSWAREGLARDYGVDTAKVTVIAPGVDVTTWAAPDRRVDDGAPLRVLFVGGDLARKGGHDLVAAVRLLRDEAPVELHLVTGAAVDPEPGVIVHRGLQPNDPALVELYHRADVFCLPTAGDCLPMVLAEAGAARLPIVSTPVGAIPELVRPGETGELVEVGDVRGLAAALRSLRDEPERRVALGAGAAALVAADHDAAKNAGRIVDVIAGALPARGSTA